MRFLGPLIEQKHVLHLWEAEFTLDNVENLLNLRMHLRSCESECRWCSPGDGSWRTETPAQRMLESDKEWENREKTGTFFQCSLHQINCREGLYFYFRITFASEMEACMPPVKITRELPEYISYMVRHSSVKINYED